MFFEGVLSLVFFNFGLACRPWWGFWHRQINDPDYNLKIKRNTIVDLQGAKFCNVLIYLRLEKNSETDMLPNEILEITLVSVEVDCW